MYSRARITASGPVWQECPVQEGHNVKGFAAQYLAAKIIRIGRIDTAAVLRTAPAVTTPQAAA